MIVMAEALLTLDEVASMLRIKRRTVQKFIDNGTLEAVKVGGRWRVRPEAIEDYLVKNTKAKEDQK